MPDVQVKDGRIFISFGDEPEEVTPAEARQIADELSAAAVEGERQQRALWALCDEDHDWSQWFNGHNPFRNHYRRCLRPGCIDGYEQYPGWMPFAARPHADMFGPRQCYGPGCDHCETEQFGEAVRGFLRQAAARMDEFLDDTSEVRS